MKPSMAPVAPSIPQRPPLRLLPGGKKSPINGPGHSVDILPPPPNHSAVRKLALLVYEILESHRSLENLGTWPTTDVLKELRLLRSLRQGRASLTPQNLPLHSTQPLLPGPAHLHSPSNEVLEAAVTLMGPHRAVAIALRFELVHARWKLTRVGAL